jgi:hypothetical protein
MFKFTTIVVTLLAATASTEVSAEGKVGRLPGEESNNRRRLPKGGKFAKVCVFQTIWSWLLFCRLLILFKHCSRLSAEYPSVNLIRIQILRACGRILCPA